MPVIVYVNRAADCNIEQFMACNFDNNLKALAITGEPTQQQLEEAWETIYTEYIDLSGTMIEELDLMKQAKVLECDIQAMHCFLFVQEQMIQQFGKPHLENMEMLNKEYNARLKWDEEKPDKEAFKKQLLQLRTNQSTKVVRLAEKNKQLEAFRKKQKKTPTVNNSRKVFVSTIIELGKFGYHIDKKKTSVEELAVMINNYSEHSKNAMEHATKN